MKQSGYKNRCKGCFYGSIVGDALGGPVEFRKRGSFPLVRDMNLINMNLGLEPGGWTDDTSMMLCLAESLSICGSLDYKDNLQRYLKWYREGYMSSTHECVDIGKQTMRALINFELSGATIAPQSCELAAGNGSIMRLAAIPIAYYNNTIQECMEACEMSSVTTHSSSICINACKLLGCIVYLLLHGTSKEQLLIQVRKQIPENHIHKHLLPIYKGDFMLKHVDEIKSSGYVVHTLEAALYCFFQTKSFHQAVLMAVNLGDDSDTVGCVTGMIAGAYYGIHNIPSSWINKLHKPDLLHHIWKSIAPS